MRARVQIRTPISAAVLTVLLVAGCASQPTSRTASSAPPVTSVGVGSSAASTVATSPAESPVASTPAPTSPAASAPAPSAPESGGPPDPCLAPVVEQPGAVPVPDPAADRVVICHPGAVLGRAGSVVLNQNDANNIGKLLDLAPAGAGNCSYKPDVLLRFEFRDEPEEDVEITSVGCDHPIVSVAGRTWLLPAAFAEFVSADAIAPGLPGKPVPDVTGLSLAEATTVITRAGLTIYAGGRVTDELLSADTVVLQDPPAGTGIIGSEVDVLLSQRPASACSLSQLAFDYHGVQYGTGDAFADLDVRNTGAKPCTLTGPISVVGVKAGGLAVTNRVTLSVADQLVLTPRARARGVDGGTPIGVVIAWIPLQANVRDGPDANGSCVDHLVSPAKWLITVAGDQTAVGNGAGPTEPPMPACEGQLASGPMPATIGPLN